MPRTKRQWTLKEAERIFNQNGYVRKRHGEHWVYVNDSGNHIAIPKNPNPMIMRRLIKENNLVVDKM